ncbi:hypothetical protein EBAPG3_009335 [Nitrosospira lacus]|uniref:TubC N-terminal docking domain-containing protein n=1 Tax=Nitrosospira lacus TaxID=1288494 RepID=A0A1W6SQA7_9PROT|nr:hypothetical protein [Nitrosospira lacus]ARO87952.1 hypothetical protein EBAPG3_009335 [Nitrosospira lacus]
MSPAEMIDQATSEGLSLTISPDGNIRVVGDQNIIDIWKPLIRERKAEIVELLRKDLSKQRVLEMLGTDAGKKYAFLVDDATTDPVGVTVAIRGIALFEMHIPHAHYDGLALLQVIEQHSMEKTTCANTTPSPEAKELSHVPGELKRKAA